MTSPLRRLAALARSRLAAFVVIALLAQPLLATLLAPAAESREQRALAAALKLPSTWEEALKLPAAADAWINDRFGWRMEMVVAYTRLRHDVFGRFPTNQVSKGRGGRIFLASHTNGGPGDQYGAIHMACGWRYDKKDSVVEDFNNFARVYHAKGLDPKVLIVPSAPIVYAEQLPAWQAKRCLPASAPAYAIMAAPALTPQARRLIFFPLPQMRAARGTDAMFPLTFFHWSGAGPALAAGLTQQHFWQRPPDGGAPIPMAASRKQSDIQWLFPGLARDSVAADPVFAGTTISPCGGASCFPGMQSLMDKLVVVGKFSNSAAGLQPRLVLVTDSFGLAGAPWFARYYSEVVYVSTNGLAQLSKAEMAQLRGLLFRPGSKDELLFLYHDVTVYSNRLQLDMVSLVP